jgi:hypothetical protein
MNTDSIVFPRRCERRVGPLTLRRVSFFTDKTICGVCHAKETATVAELRLTGQPWSCTPKKHRHEAAH